MALQSGIRRRFKDETGKRYGKLEVLRFYEMRKGQPYWTCQCDCGRKKPVRGANLRSGNTSSCGCSRRKVRKGKLVCRTISRQFVIGRVDPNSSKSKWVAQCVFCNTINFHTERQLNNRKAARCKCLRRTHISWLKMIERCTNENHAQFADYGGRGITVCNRWRESFSDFVDDMKRRPDGKTLDRINNDGGYYPENCRWATKKQQAESRRKPRRK
jgi:hypothetical protein